MRLERARSLKEFYRKFRCCGLADAHAILFARMNRRLLHGTSIARDEIGRSVVRARVRQTSGVEQHGEQGRRSKDESDNRARLGRLYGQEPVSELGCVAVRLVWLA